jgi:hypothetical protein
MKARIDTNKKKSSATKKLIPAAGALMISAAMLGTSTFAWFTMSKEAEVRNIQMTATIPENLQISLGKIASSSSTVNLGMSTGFLDATNDVVTDPTSTVVEYDWANTVDVSHYYTFGKLMPASSTDGEDIYYTTDVEGVGRTLKAGAGAYLAADGATQKAVKGGTFSDYTTGTKATAHVNATATDNAANWFTKETGGYLAATSADVPNDDGYYIDIPIWVRSAKTEQVSLYVTGYVTSNQSAAADADTDDLYKAVRVAVLSDAGAAAGGVLALNDGLQTKIDPYTDANHFATFPTTVAALKNGIVDSDNYSGSGDANALSGISGLAGRAGAPTNSSAVADIYGMSAATPAWNKITLNQGATSVGTVAASASAGTYGTATKLILRVWLEGEDGNCWNANAGQDWNIALKFSTDQLPAGS